MSFSRSTPFGWTPSESGSTPHAEPVSTVPSGSGSIDVAIVIPCYNVERHIASVIRSIPARYQCIICVDDASPDDTAAVIAGVRDPRVRLVRHAKNRGVGGATMSGYRAALELGAAVCVKMDGDGQMSADDIAPLVAPLLAGKAEYAKGNRFVYRTQLRVMPPLRLLGNAALSFATKAASGYWNVLDPTNGFTAIRADVLRGLVFGSLQERYFFETSLLIELNILGARTIDIPMPARYGDEQSSLRISRVLATFPGLLLRGILRRFYWRYLILDFNVTSVCVLLGLPLCAFGVAFGAYHWWLSSQTGVTASAGTVILAALPIIMGFQLLLGAAILDVLASPNARAGD